MKLRFQVRGLQYASGQVRGGCWADSGVLIGVLFGCFGRQIDGDSWFIWWFNELPGPSISTYGSAFAQLSHVELYTWRYLQSPSDPSKLGFVTQHDVGIMTRFLIRIRRRVEGLSSVCSFGAYFQGESRGCHFNGASYASHMNQKDVKWQVFQERTTGRCPILSQ